MSAAHRRGKINRDRGWSDDIPPIPVSKIDAELYGALREAEGDNALLIDNQIHIGPFTLTSTGLQIQAGVTQDEWSKIGELLFRLEGSIQWLIGDWLAYGEDVKWGQTPELAERLGREPQTLYHYKSIAQSFEFCRRRQNLSFSHHEGVRGLPLEQQDWALDQAESQKMSVATFRKWLREWQLAEKASQIPDGVPHSSSRALFEPPTNQFLKFLRQDKTEAEAYISQVEQWAAAMRKQYLQEREDD